jgi:hypothetical protein
MEDRIARLVAESNAESEVAEDMQHALTAMGPQVLDAAIATLPGLDRSASCARSSSSQSWATNVLAMY